MRRPRRTSPVPRRGMDWVSGVLAWLPISKLVTVNVALDVAGWIHNVENGALLTRPAYAAPFVVTSLNSHVPMLNSTHKLRNEFPVYVILKPIANTLEGRVILIRSPGLFSISALVGIRNVSDVTPPDLNPLKSTSELSTYSVAPEIRSADVKTIGDVRDNPAVATAPWNEGLSVLKEKDA